MKLSTRDDIEVPVAFVYAALTDVAGWERAARSRGAEVRRLDKKAFFGTGMQWDVGFAFRGKPRRAEIALTAAEAEQLLSFNVMGHAFEATVKTELVALSAKRTRLIVSTEIKPRTLAGRVLLQPLKLGRARVDRKYESRVAQFCADLEARHRAGV